MVKHVFEKELKGQDTHTEQKGRIHTATSERIKPHQAASYARTADAHLWEVVAVRATCHDRGSLSFDKGKIESVRGRPCVWPRARYRTYVMLYLA